MMLGFEAMGRKDRAAQASAFAESIRARLSPGAVMRQDEPMARRTTLRVGGPADVFIEPGTIEDLSLILRTCNERRMPLFIIGRGSNLLVKDGGFRGVIVSLGNQGFSSIEPVEGALRAGAGARLKQVAVEARSQEWAGFEFLEGIPGSVGGALRMNAGAMGSAFFDLVESVQYMNSAGEMANAKGTELGAGYRSCGFFECNIALSALLRGSKGTRSVIEQRMRHFNERRWSTQPAAPSAGCMFKNPKEIPAGKLIDDLGLKGMRVGGASVSQEHGNFLITDGNAASRDVTELMRMIREKALSARGISLESEVQVIGEEISETEIAPRME